jgi:hypothetical protein
MRSFPKLALILGGALVASAIAAPAADAQRRFRPASRIVVRGHYGFPYHGSYYSPYYSGYRSGLYGWGPQYWGAYGGQWREDGGERTVGVRLDVSPKEAQVYVDGYFRGTATDFEGPFKRLRLEPGQRDLVLYLKGYKAVRVPLDIRIGTEPRVRETLAPLAAGEANEPPPSPPPRTERPAEREAAPGIDRPSPDEPRRRVLRPGQTPREAPPEPAAVEARGFGSIAIRVQPAGAEILIDGERWQGPEGPGPLVVELARGSHRVEIRKEGYESFTTEVRVTEGERAALNVSLPARQ